MTSDKTLTHIVGTFLIQAEGAFLNGAGLGSGEDRNTTIPKTMLDFKEEVPYVSSQSWKRWLRDTYKEENPNDPAAVILTTDVNDKNNTKKLGTKMDPVIFAEDDIFGFMKTQKEQGKTLAENKDKESNEEDKEDKEDENEEISGQTKVKSTMRVSPFQASILISLRKTGWKGVDLGFVHPKGVDPELLRDKPNAMATPQPYNTKFYNTQLQGIFGLNYSRLGVFRNEGDRIELDQALVSKYEKNGQIKKIDGDRELYEMVDNPRKERATKILKSLAVMRGGAKQAQFGTPVHPQVLIVAGLTCGNLIFNDLFEDTKEGPKLKLETFKEILADFKDRITGTVYVGIRTGYLQSDNEKQLREWAINSNNVVEICTPIEAINKLTNELSD